jgi:hypothetical protein
LLFGVGLTLAVGLLAILIIYTWRYIQLADLHAKAEKGDAQAQFNRKRPVGSILSPVVLN